MTKEEIADIEQKIQNRLKDMLNTIEHPNKDDNDFLIADFKERKGYTKYDKKIVRSISLTVENDNFINEMQAKASKDGNFISKDLIVNIALNHLLNDEQDAIKDFNDWLIKYT